jgi:hypothetical protein
MAIIFRAYVYMHQAAASQLAKAFIALDKIEENGKNKLTVASLKCPA